ncbi:ribonuclease E activity regulator RraA [Reinekea sp.]|jgi:regulator of ribonuclease activity A|uniref:ribonuclease E activity regulator RraA n=1 Tax=Reinekea sp. TaxID=1970455 RepID=UPI0039892400
MWNTPDLCDDFPEDVTVLPPMFQSFGGKAAFCGKVVTVKCFEDNSRVKELAATDGTNSVMVVDGGASMRAALIGDLIAANAIKNGWQGIIISGCCRDVHELQTMDFGVFALAAFPIKSNRKGAGETNVELDIAGRKITADMWVYADQTGVVFANKALL